MARLVITTPCAVTWGGKTENYHRGDVLEAPAALVTLIGANARTITINPNAVSPTRDQMGEAFGVSNSTG
jgi:hypothetical protein